MRMSACHSGAGFVTRVLCLLHRGGLCGVAYCALLVSCGGKGETSFIPLATSALLDGRPVPGRAIVLPLTGQAASNHAEFCAKICDNLGRVPFEARFFADPKKTNETLRCRLFKPLNFDPTRHYPLVLFLHGGGATRSFDELLNCASPVFAFGPARLVAPEAQAQHPAFVVVPWSGGGSWNEENTRLILGMVDALAGEFPIDRRRLYVTGQSMGGFGTWQMITQHPDEFAAAVPVCGGGDPALAARAKGVAIWAFHGSADGIVPVSETRGMIAALFQAGGQPVYWEYDGGTHAKTAESAYCEPQLLDWLFAQARP